MVSQWDQGACPRNTWYPNIAVRPFKLQEMQLPVFFLHHGGWAWWRQVWAARNVELIALCEASANMVLLQSMESMGLQCILWASHTCCLKKLKPIWHALPSPAGRDQQLLWLPERPEFTMECMESKGSKASATTENQTSAWSLGKSSRLECAIKIQTCLIRIISNPRRDDLEWCKEDRITCT